MRIIVKHRRILIAAAALVGVAAATAFGFGVAVHQLKGSLEQSLGPRASVGTLQVGWTGVEALDVRVRADRARDGWPSEDELRARRVHLQPALASLWRPGWHIQRVTIEDAYVSALRTRDGHLRIFPSLLHETRRGAAPTGGETSAPLIRLGTVQLTNAAFDFHDASVRQPAHRLRIERLNAVVGPLVLPKLDQSASVELRGLLKGPRGDGELHIAGEFTAATRDAQLKARFNGVDLIALQPYLLKVAEGGVRAGVLDLELQATVAHNRLHAPGSVTLRGLELGSAGGVLGTFAGVPRQAVVAAMSRDGRIHVKFVLDGNLDDPNFSINENLATRVTSGLAETLGVSLGGVVQGVGNVIKGIFGR